MFTRTGEDLQKLRQCGLLNAGLLTKEVSVRVCKNASKSAFCEGAKAGPPWCTSPKGSTVDEATPPEVVMVNDLFEDFESTVVHVGCAEGNIPKGGCPESSGVQRVAGDRHPSRVGFKGGIQPVVVEQVVCKLQACFAVAVKTVCPDGRQGPPRDRLLHGGTFGSRCIRCR